MLPVWKAKNSHSIFIPVWYQHKMFILLCSFFTWLFTLFMRVVFVHSVCLFAYHCFFTSDRNKAWPGGNCPYLPIAHWSLSSFTRNMWHITPLLSAYPNKLYYSPSQHSWDMTLIPSLFPLFPSRKKTQPSQYWGIHVKRPYWECCLIAFRRHKAAKSTLNN